MDRSLFLDLIYRTKTGLGSIENLVQRSRGRFTDREFGELFFKNATAEIEGIDLLLNGFLSYVKATSPAVRKDTVNDLIEEVVKKHGSRLSERHIRLSRNFEKELPDTVVPDKQLVFMLDSLLQYAIASAPGGGSIDLSTRSSLQTKEAEALFGADGKTVEVMVAFTDQRKPGEHFVSIRSSEPPPPEADLLLRLVYFTALRNYGTLEFQTDERNARRLVVLRLPAERRRAVSDEPADD